MAPGTWVCAMGNRSLSLVSRTTTVTGYDVLRSSVMGTLAVPAVSRMVSERTDRPLQLWSRADSNPSSAACCWRGDNRLDSAARSRSSVAWAVAAPAGLPGHARWRSRPAGPGRRAGRRRAGIAGRRRDAADAVDDVTTWRDVAWLSAPTGTWAKSWSRVTGWITGLPARPGQERGDEGGARAPTPAGATATTPRGAGSAPRAPEVGRLVVDERQPRPAAGRRPARRPAPFAGHEPGPEPGVGHHRRGAGWPRPSTPATGAKVKGWVTVSGPVGPDTEPGGTTRWA